MKLHRTYSVVIFAIAACFFPLDLPSQNLRVSGIVADSATREILVGAVVRVAGTAIGTSTDQRGRFHLGGLEEGSYVIRFSFVGYASVERSISIFKSDSVWLEIYLEPEILEEEIVVITGTRTRHSIADVPVRMEAIPQEEVEEKLLMTPSNVAMLLNESTGMRVQTTSAAASTANLRIQGLSGRYTQILNDGIPSLSGLSAGLSLTQLVPLDLRQVEVLKGATSSLYGADAIAGVVNFIPKLPGEHPETQLLLNGTTQRGFDAVGFASNQVGSTGVSLLVSHNRQAKFDVDGDGFADVGRYERTTITPRGLFPVSEAMSIRFGLSYLQEDRAGGAMAENTLPGTSAIPYAEKIGTRRWDATSHMDWRLAEDRTISLKLAQIRSWRDASVDGEPFSARQDITFGDAQFSELLGDHSLLFGTAYRIDDFQDRTTGIVASRSFRFEVPSVFAQDEFHVNDQIVLLASGRFDVHNVYGSFFVPRVSVMYRPSSSFTIRLGGGTGYKAPTIFVEEAEEAGFHDVRPIVNALPEKARSASVDINGRAIVGSFSLVGNAAVFVTELDNALIADEDSLEIDVVFLRNATGKGRSIGSELSFRMSYDKLKIMLGYTYTYATQDDRGGVSEVELNPRHAAGIVAFWEDHDNQLKIGLENYWTGKQKLLRNPYRRLSPSYWITGLIAEKGFGNFRFFVNFENVFDTRQTRFDPLFTGGLASGGLRQLPVYAPLEGRVFNAGIRLMLHSL